MRTIRRRLVAGATVTAAALVLTGCASQLAGLAPVGGDALTGVRFAVVDVLLDKGYEIRQAPVCSESDDHVRCQGSLMDGSTVTAAADIGTSPHTMTVTVGDAVVYEGDVQSVLDEAARATS